MVFYPIELASRSQSLLKQRYEWQRLGPGFSTNEGFEVAGLFALGDKLASISVCPEIWDGFQAFHFDQIMEHMDRAASFAEELRRKTSNVATSPASYTEAANNSEAVNSGVHGRVE
jgi:hypothetical protein